MTANSALPRSKLRTRRRARTSSSTINVRMGFIIYHWCPALFAPGAVHLRHPRRSKRNRQFDNQTALVAVLDLYPMLVAVELPQPGARVGQPDAFFKLFSARLQPGAIINYLQLDYSVPAFSADLDAPG